MLHAVPHYQDLLQAVYSRSTAKAALRSIMALARPAQFTDVLERDSLHCGMQPLAGYCWEHLAKTTYTCTGPAVSMQPHTLLLLAALCCGHMWLVVCSSLDMGPQLPCYYALS